MTTRTPLRRDLTDLKQKVYLLGEKCIEISDLYNLLLEAFSDNQENAILQITKDVKKECKEITEQCFMVLTLQQPLIKDLRFVIGSLQIVLNLAKISEQYTTTLSQITEINILKNTFKDGIIKMATIIQNLLKNSLTLYLSSSLTQTDDIQKNYAEINYMHNILYKLILKEVAQESGEKAQVEAQLLSTIRSLEKISDLIINIIEQVHYIIVGKTEFEQTT